MYMYDACIYVYMNDYAGISVIKSHVVCARPGQTYICGLQLLNVCGLQRMRPLTFNVCDLQRIWLSTFKRMWPSTYVAFNF